jgi:hypothetical protein
MISLSCPISSGSQKPKALMAAATSRTRAGSSLRSLRAERLSVLRGRYESAIEGRRSLRRRVDSDDSARRSCSSSLLVRFFAPSCPRNVGVGAIGSNRLVMLCFRLSRTSGSLKPALPTVHGTVSIESLQPNVRAKTLRFVKQKVIVGDMPGANIKELRGKTGLRTHFATDEFAPL